MVALLELDVSNIPELLTERSSLPAAWSTLLTSTLSASFLTSVPPPSSSIGWRLRPSRSWLGFWFTWDWDCERRRFEADVFDPLLTSGSFEELTEVRSRGWKRDRHGDEETESKNGLC